LEGSVPPRTGVTEEFNGTSWSEVADMATARQNLAGAGIKHLLH
jgi:hypothetical protein